MGSLCWLLPWHVYESVVESLDIMEDPDMVDALRKSMDGIPGGRSHTHR